MKPIQFEVDEMPQAGTVDAAGNFKFYIYMTNQCEDEIEEAFETLAKLWDLPADVSLKINIRLKDVYIDLYNMHNARGKIDAEDMHLFQALKDNCQWIIDEINKLEVYT